MANRCLKNCPLSLIIRGMQIEITSRNCLTTVRMSSICVCVCVNQVCAVCNPSYGGHQGRSILSPRPALAAQRDPSLEKKHYRCWPGPGRTWRNRNTWRTCDSHTDGAATTETSVEAPCKVRTRTTVQSRNPTDGMYPEPLTAELKIHPCRSSSRKHSSQTERWLSISLLLRALTFYLFLEHVIHFHHVSSQSFLALYPPN